ncbi:MAG: hypothetical protein QNL04_09335 [SAR324 cluster bacterium]|nr:hypothetical protein [SAR324 cluster bacterium]
MVAKYFKLKFRVKFLLMGLLCIPTLAQAKVFTAATAITLAPKAAHVEKFVSHKKGLFGVDQKQLYKFVKKDGSLASQTNYLIHLPPASISNARFIAATKGGNILLALTFEQVGFQLLLFSPELKFLKSKKIAGQTFQKFVTSPNGILYFFTSATGKTQLLEVGQELNTKSLKTIPTPAGKKAHLLFDSRGKSLLYVTEAPKFGKNENSFFAAPTGQMDSNLVQAAPFKGGFLLQTSAAGQTSFSLLPTVENPTQLKISLAELGRQDILLGGNGVSQFEVVKTQGQRRTLLTLDLKKQYLSKSETAQEMAQVRGRNMGKSKKCRRERNKNLADQAIDATTVTAGNVNLSFNSPALNVISGAVQVFDFVANDLTQGNCQ